MSVPKFKPVHLLVAGVTVAAGLGFAFEWGHRGSYPGHQTLLVFLVGGLLLESRPTNLRAGATGSTSFIIDCAAALLFGAFWAGLLTALTTGTVQAFRRNPHLKILFNVAQRALCVISAVAAYEALGGQIRPGFLVAGTDWLDPGLKRDAGLFIVLALTYFALNSTLVSSAVALSSGRQFREVWHLNTRGIIGYDLGAVCIMAPVVAFSYSRAEFVGLIASILPVVAVRHFYGLYHQLQASGQEMLAVMVKAIEARDPYTSGHSERVSAFSRAVAQELGLAAQQVEEITTAALLHDVGKIHEEFAPLLRKESRLTPEEMALMQTHVLRSAELVSIVSKFRGRILEAVRHHHERWDGQGYPDGLQHKNIPVGARIILIADTIDAMTTDRPYRKALGLDVVVAELQRCKGTQFDPDLVELVISSVAVRRIITAASGTESGVQEYAPPSSRRVALKMPGGWWKRGA